MDSMTAELNNLGVECLEAGNLGTALQLLRDALQCTVASLTTSEDNFPVQQQLKPRYCTNFHSHCASIDSTLQSVGTASTAFVHKTGINIVPLCALDGTQNGLDVVQKYISSAIILFNLAIVCHLKALEDDRISVTKLQKAQSLYRKSSSLLSGVGISVTESTGNAIIDLLLLALNNNLAQSSFELLKYEESGLFFDDLVKFASTIEPSGYDDMYISSCLEKLKSKLLLNAIILRPPVLASAA